MASTTPLNKRRIKMQVDEYELKGLLEQSKDIHADAMRDSTGLLDDFVDVGLEARSHGEVDLEEARSFAAARSDGLKRGLVGVGAAAGIGASLLALS
jgi:hypothetical protein